jgi:hypothetical protein
MRYAVDFLPRGSDMQFGQLKRREFVMLLGGAAAWPLAVRAQQGERVRRIGVLLPAAPDDAEFQSWVGAFLQGLWHAVQAISTRCSTDFPSASSPPARGANHQSP